MTDKIIPTPGRIVHYYPGVSDGLSQFGKGTSDAQPLAAIVTGVHADNMVNLCVFDSYGNPHARPNVYLVQPGLASPDHAHCEWMPYQVKVAGIELPVVDTSFVPESGDAGSVSDTTETGDNNGVEVPDAETIAPGAEVQTDAASTAGENTQEPQ